MGHIKYASYTVDQCVNCKGMWFDHLEVENLKRVKGAGKIDCGLPKTGKSFDSIKDIS